MQNENDLKGLCHDIRNMLASVQVSLYELEQIDTPETTQAVQKVNYAVEKCAAFCNHAMQRRAKAQLEDLTSDVNLHDLLHEITSYVDQKNAGKLWFRMVCAKNIFIQTCRTALYRVLVNLIENATYATLSAKRNQISVTVSISQNLITVEICDGGNGFPDKLMQEINDGSIRYKKRDISMHGIGLPTTLELVRDLSGDLFVERSGENGSTVKLILPASISWNARPEGTLNDVLQGFGDRLPVKSRNNRELEYQ